MVYEKLNTSLGLAILFKDSFTNTQPIDNVEFKFQGNTEQKLIKKNNNALLFLEHMPNTPFKIVVHSKFYHDAVISFVDSKYYDSIGCNTGKINSKTNVAGPIKLLPNSSYPFTFSDFILRGMLTPIEKDAVYKVAIDKFACYTIATQKGEFVLPIDITCEPAVKFIISFINNDSVLDFDVTITKYVKKQNMFEPKSPLEHPVTLNKMGHINLGKIAVEQ